VVGPVGGRAIYQNQTCCFDIAAGEKTEKCEEFFLLFEDRSAKSCTVLRLAIEEIADPRTRSDVLPLSRIG
jgi:hypothetical protein